MKKRNFKKGTAVRVFQSGFSGTVTQVTRDKVRVLFPIRSFHWLNKSDVIITGFDGDGSSIGWK
jgi:hypothetical protein